MICAGKSRRCSQDENSFASFLSGGSERSRRDSISRDQRRHRSKASRPLLFILECHSNFPSVTTDPPSSSKCRLSGSRRRSRRHHRRRRTTSHGSATLAPPARLNFSWPLCCSHSRCCSASLTSTIVGASMLVGYLANDDDGSRWTRLCVCRSHPKHQDPAQLDHDVLGAGPDHQPGEAGRARCAGSVISPS